MNSETTMLIQPDRTKRKRIFLPFRPLEAEDNKSKYNSQKNSLKAGGSQTKNRLAEYEMMGNKPLKACLRNKDHLRLY